MDIRQTMQKHRTFMIYALYGGITVLLNFAVFFGAKYLIRLDYLEANALAWIVSVLFSFFVNKRRVFRSTAIGRMRFEAMTFLAERMATLALVQLGLYYFTVLIPWNQAIPQLFGEDLLKIGLTVVEATMNYFLAKFISFSDRAYAYYRRHVVTVTSIVTAIINYAVYAISKRLIFGIDYYMFADMLAWLVASVYFFTVMHDQMKNSKSNAVIVNYIICLFSFLCTHMILRFTYGTWKWNIDIVKPVLVIVSVAIAYVLVQVLFPALKLVDHDTPEEK